MDTNYNGETSSIPLHLSTRVIISTLLRNWILEKENVLEHFKINPLTPQWIEQTEKILEYAKEDLYSIDSV
jgi:hypothetical protein